MPHLIILLILHIQHGLNKTVSPRHTFKYIQNMFKTTKTTIISFLALKVISVLHLNRPPITNVSQKTSESDTVVCLDFKSWSLLKMRLFSLMVVLFNRTFPASKNIASAFFHSVSCHLSTSKTFHLNLFCRGAQKTVNDGALNYQIWFPYSL